jgi:glycosyltransferase involved in cell wall biosynthesis
VSGHLCFVSNEIYPGTRGGIGRLLNATAHELVQAGWRLSFLLTTPTEAAQTFARYADEHLPGVAVYTVEDLLGNLSADQDIPLWAFHFPEYHQSYRIALALRTLCRQVPLDGIEFTDYLGPGYVALKWRRMWGDEFDAVRMWVRLHGTSELCRAFDNALTFSRAQQQLFAMERYCLRHADGWISPSLSMAQWYRRVYQCEDQPVVIAPPLFERFGSGRSHPRTLGPAPYRVLYYGKLQYLKGIDLFIQAAVQLCERSDLPVTFEIVGYEAPHPWGESYQRLCENLIPPVWRERFRFHGPIPSRDLEQLALGCTLAVVPSRVETFCLAAHELNWIGIPLVLNNLPAFQDFFQDGVNCRTFDGTAEDLTRVLLELLSHPDPFAHWEWNAPQVIARQREHLAYVEVLERFQPFAPAPAPEPAPLVSIVIPYYNMHHYVDATLDSVRSSIYHNWELILVDDGSPDPAAQAKFADLEREHQSDPRYHFVRKPNGGLGSARNYGIQHARGAYILPLDSDDLIYPGYIERGVRALNRLPELAAVSCFVGYFQDGEPPDQIIDYVIPYDLHPILITLENRAGVACSLFRRKVFEHFRYDEALAAYEDWELWWQLAEAEWEVEPMPMLLYRYRRRHDSMFHTTASYRHIHLLAHFADRHAEFLRQHGDAVFRAYVGMVSELRRDNEVLRMSSSNKLYYVLKRLYSEVRDIRGSKTYRLAQVIRLIAAPLRRMVHRTATSHGRLRRQKVELEVLGAKHPDACGHEIWVGGLRPGNSNVYSLSPLRSVGQWQLREVDHAMIDKALVATRPGQVLRAHVTDEGFGLVLRRFPRGGRVRLSIGPYAHEIDLYASELRAGFCEYRWSGQRWERHDLPC